MPFKWGIAAGGTSAASDKKTYDCQTEIGNYVINPVSSPNNVERHIGYRVYFVNVFGKSGTGLWQELSPTLVPLVTAKKLCREHFEENKN